jgi:hypothetical protein
MTAIPVVVKIVDTHLTAQVAIAQEVAAMAMVVVLTVVMVVEALIVVMAEAPAVVAMVEVARVMVVEVADMVNILKEVVLLMELVFKILIGIYLLYLNLKRTFTLNILMLLTVLNKKLKLFVLKPT